MPAMFVSEALVPDPASISHAASAPGEPGLPRRFTWRGEVAEVAAVLEAWKEHGPCTHGSGERYLRRHGYRLRMGDGAVWRIYFERQARSRSARRARWWLQSVEAAPAPDGARPEPPGRAGSRAADSGGG